MNHLLGREVSYKTVDLYDVTFLLAENWKHLKIKQLNIKQINVIIVPDRRIYLESGEFEYQIKTGLWVIERW